MVWGKEPWESRLTYIPVPCIEMHHIVTGLKKMLWRVIIQVVNTRMLVLSGVRLSRAKWDGVCAAGRSFWRRYFPLRLLGLNFQCLVRADFAASAATETIDLERGCGEQDSIHSTQLPCNASGTCRITNVLEMLNVKLYMPVCFDCRPF